MSSNHRSDAPDRPTSAPSRENVRGRGRLIINADDWGRDAMTTNAIRECVERGAVSSASAMVFMEDSVRAAAIAREQQLDVGLHLNLTTPFSSPRVSAALLERQRGLCHYLRRRRLNQVVFHPGLARSFEYVVAAQLDEFTSTYGVAPTRIDGHHHMHLCANVLLQKLLPAGVLVRRNFSFGRGEKSILNRLYRHCIDTSLQRRHRLVDFLFPLAPVDQSDRLRNIFNLSRERIVEVETHPVNHPEQKFLLRGELFRLLGDVPVATGFPTETAVNTPGQ
jgi:hypothetical protein